MAIAWSRISSKVIATPLYADAACRRQCEHGKGCAGTFIPHMVIRGKQEVLWRVTNHRESVAGTHRTWYHQGRPRVSVFSLQGVLDYVAYHLTPYVDPGP